MYLVHHVLHLARFNLDDRTLHSAPVTLLLIGSVSMSACLFVCPLCGYINHKP